MNEYFASIGSNLAEGIPEGVDESPRGHLGHGGNSEISEFLGRKIPSAILPFHAFLIIIVQEPNTLRPRGFRLCEPLVHIR